MGRKRIINHLFFKEKIIHQNFFALRHKKKCLYYVYEIDNTKVKLSIINFTQIIIKKYPKSNLGYFNEINNLCKSELCVNYVHDGEVKLMSSLQDRIPYHFYDLVQIKENYKKYKDELKIRLKNNEKVKFFDYNGNELLSSELYHKIADVIYSDEFTNKYIPSEILSKQPIYKQPKPEKIIKIKEPKPVKVIKIKEPKPIVEKIKPIKVTKIVELKPIRVVKIKEPKPAKINVVKTKPEKVQQFNQIQIAYKTEKTKLLEEFFAKIKSDISIFSDQKIAPTVTKTREQIAYEMRVKSLASGVK